MKGKTLDWLISAEADLKTISKIIDDGSITQVVAFHAQQAIEKAFKAVIEELNLSSVKTHDIENLYYAVIAVHHSLPVDIKLIKILNKLYLDSRYPSDLGLMSDGKPNLSDASK